MLGEISVVDKKVVWFSWVDVLFLSTSDEKIHGATTTKKRVLARSWWGRSV